MVIKISLPIFITQTITFLHNKMLQKVYNLFSLLLLTFYSLLLKLSCPMEWSRFITYLLKLQTATWRLLIGIAIFWQIHAQKKLLLYSAARLTSWIYGVKKIRQPKMRKDNYLESKYQLGVDQLAIYEVKPRSWTRDNRRKIHGVAW